MCGIFVLVCPSGDKEEALERFDRGDQKKLLERRGNNQQGNLTIDLINEEGTSVLFMYGSVLHVRGNRRADQPIKDLKGNVLLFNGEILSGPLIAKEDIDNEVVSDTQLLLDLLTACNSKDLAIANCFAAIRGPFAYAYWDNSSRKLWFGRDILGRRSLCWNRNRNSTTAVSHFALCSVAAKEGTWSEVPCNGFYNCHLGAVVSFGATATRPPSSLPLQIHPLLKYAWRTSVSGAPVIDSKSAVVTNCDSELFVDDDGTTAAVVDTLVSPITGALSRQTIHDCSTAQFEQTVETTRQNLINVLDEAVRLRGTLHNFKCQVCIVAGEVKRCPNCGHSSVAVLFSGGIDSTVIALLLDNHLPQDIPIDLLNVAFDVDAPDRQTGLRGHDELCKLRPTRKWNLVQIDVTKDELIKERNKHIRKLVYPLETVLDDSIGCSLWFAARGIGRLEGLEYKSPARILLHGLGADEQLAGYSRHRRTFDSGGLNGLIEEIALELDRLSHRNLGRDDRIASDHSKEVRFPFLDEQVISFLNEVPVQVKCDLTEPRGVGEKKLLRSAARQLGLLGASANEKRAIQFGSRIAKLEKNKKEKGDMKCERLSLR